LYLSFYYSFLPFLFDFLRQGGSQQQPAAGSSRVQQHARAATMDIHVLLLLP
jgi:hypothetical protein